MKFLDLQQTVVGLIQASASFSDSPDVKVLYDFGFSKNDFESALDLSATPAGPGYCVGVWPVTHGSAQDAAVGLPGIYATIVVRFEVNPKLLTSVQAAHVGDESLPTPGKFMNSLLKEIIDAVLSDESEAGGVKFELAEDAFELVNMDEGAVAFHLRFRRFCTL